MGSTSAAQRDGAIVVVAKCPIPGKSKTRLAARYGKEGSAALARSMLCDVLTSLEKCTAINSYTKVLLYAPGNDDGLAIMKGIMASINLAVLSTGEERQQNADASWTLLPMHSTVLQSSALSAILSDALRRVRDLIDPDGSVVFLGMDAPELPLDDIARALGQSHGGDEATPRKAILCPASDGGYGMLSVPSQADTVLTFERVLWSHPLTALCQIKALTDQGIQVALGKLMHDIDEPQDLDQLMQRVGDNSNQSLPEPSTTTSDSESILESPAAAIADSTEPLFDCKCSHATAHFTKQTLDGINNESK
mmetsp:Transcript_12666/g.34949  ORF Transcript_12666/g.34949 Transcript_12666/m.34949 type:complete len:308 (-) Transcript_12666:51-974(-)